MPNGIMLNDYMPNETDSRLTPSAVLKIRPSKCTTRIRKPMQVIPELSVNLISVNQIVNRGHTVTFNLDGVHQVVNPTGQVIATGTKCNDLFKLDQLASCKALACSSTETLNLWHRRIGHLNLDSPCRLKKKGWSRKCKYLIPLRQE